jgi:hypothetical protein
MVVSLSMMDNHVVVSVPSIMPEQTVKRVPLRVEVSEDFKSRLKAQAGRSGATMGEILELLADEGLRGMELEALEKAKKGKG